jgi:hypothetical protein
MNEVPAMKTTILHAALATAIFATPALAQDCAGEFALLDKQIKGAALQAQYKGREADHPLVLKMKDGRLVDLTGVIVTATPYESWTGDRPVVDKVGGYLVEAKPLIEAENEAECMRLLEVARSEISAFGQRADTPASSGQSTSDN